MRKLKLYLSVMLLMVSVCVWADYAPANVQSAFKKMYPQVAHPDWSKEGNYYVAAFTKDGYETDVWFDGGARWLMTQTDWETLDNVPSPIYDAFSQGQYSNGQIENVTLVQFPNAPCVVVIEVQQYNEDIKVQLFYGGDGRLLKTRNLGYLADTLWPDLFNFD